MMTKWHQYCKIWYPEEQVQIILKYFQIVYFFVNIDNDNNFWSFNQTDGQ